MISRCTERHFDVIYGITNEAAQAYKGIIPPDRWKEPYMSREELRRELAEGVVFWGYWEQDELLGVMGIQEYEHVSLIRHAYVRPDHQRRDIGNQLLSHLRGLTSRPLLVGTWKDASWAIRFYEEQGFSLVSTEEKDMLLQCYWSIPERQIETSVVLAEERWFL
jgi:GNAT superfamily N-acetyltransferase